MLLHHAVLRRPTFVVGEDNTSGCQHRNPFPVRPFPKGEDIARFRDRGPTDQVDHPDKPTRHLTRKVAAREVRS